jgi:cyclic pyranopterin phosphate synthase
MKLIDRFGRVHDYLRISLTDKCNYNCIYCNPNNLTDETHRNDLLSFEELLRLIEFFAKELEFKKFRFTGGEPLIRKGIMEFFEKLSVLKNKYGFSTGLTTNGSLLKGKARKLKELGLDYLNISLDSLNTQKFHMITKNDELNRILKVIDESIVSGFSPLKVNAVVIKGINDNEIMNFVEYFKEKEVNLRFIEFMPFGSNEWERNGFVSYKEIRQKVKEKFELIKLPAEPNAVAKDYQMISYPLKVSFISSISEHFCSACNRVRISSTGNFRLCLFSEGEHGLNFRELFRGNYSNEEILTKIKNAMNEKWERHPEAEELTALAENNMMTIGG